MDIKDIKVNDIFILSCNADDDYVYISYQGGYEENYFNEIEINLHTKTYISKIRDINKQELLKILNKLYQKLQFDDVHYRQYSIIELYNVIESGVNTIINLPKYKNNNFAKEIYYYLQNICRQQITVLAEEFNNIDKNYIDQLINHYYLLYLQYSYQIFYPRALCKEDTTDINPLYESFYINLSNDNDNYIDDEYIESFILTKPDVSLINQYLLFAQSFVFQFTNDLKKVFT